MGSIVCAISGGLARMSETNHYVRGVTFRCVVVWYTLN